MFLQNALSDFEVTYIVLQRRCRATKVDIQVYVRVRVLEGVRGKYVEFLRFFEVFSIVANALWISGIAV